jgi:hypothetical protein
MMIRNGLMVEAVVRFSRMSSTSLDSTAYRISLCATGDERASALLRLDRSPASETDVVDARGEIVATGGLVVSRWELRQRHDDTLVAEAGISPIVVHPFAPFSCVVRLFGSGASPHLVRRQG